ncbi:MAG: response regulator [Lysobacterales bacterium]
MDSSNNLSHSFTGESPFPANSPVIIRLSGAEELVRIDPNCATLLGLSADELSARPFIDWIHPDDRAAAASALSKPDGLFEARHETASGQWVALAWHVKSDSKDAAIIGLLRARESVYPPTSSGPHARGTLHETLAAMARIVEAKNLGLRCSILLVDPETSTVSVGAGPSLPTQYNAAVEGLLIGPAVGSCGTASYWNVPVIVEDIAKDPLWRNLREAAKIAGVAACWSNPITSSNGEVLGAMALYDEKPAKPTRDQMAGLEIAARMVGLAVERDRLEDRLRQAAKMEALGVLAGGIAHDFNNVLAAILGNAELAIADTAPATTVQKSIEEIVKATTTATDLCNQMLAYAGRGVASVEAIDCNALSLELGALLQITLSKKATLRYALDDSKQLGVLADRGQLRQVIMNLVTNASESLGDNSGNITLSSSSRYYSTQELEAFHSRRPISPGEFVCLQVHDTGTGMSADTLARMFDPFFSTKAEGRGLGLAAAKGIVLGHNGAIDVDTTQGVGTTFTILLPWVPIESQPMTPSPEETQCHSASILLADDEPAVRSILCRVLEKGGYEVTAVANGQEAVDVFREDPSGFDCVVLDLSMPVLDGAETFAQLRKIQPEVQVILSSGFAEQEILNRFQGQGLCAAVQKPTSMRVLHEKVAHAVQRAKSIP